MRTNYSSDLHSTCTQFINKLQMAFCGLVQKLVILLLSSSYLLQGQYLPLSGGTLTGPLDGPTINSVLFANQWCTSPGTYDQSCILNALTNIGSSAKTLTLTQKFVLNTDLAVPANVKLKIEQGGGFNLSDGHNLIVSSPIEAGLYQIFFNANMNVYFYGGSGAPNIYPQWFGATGNAKTAGFTSIAGSATITLVGQNPFSIGDNVTLVGAGASGAPLKTTVTGSANLTVTLNDTASTTVSSARPIYDEDDSSSLNNWSNSVRAGAALGLYFYDVRSTYGPSKLYLPKGYYAVCTKPVLIYSSTILEAEQSSTNIGGSFIQCNPAISALRISANNFDPNGNLLNFGNGNSYFDHVAVRGGYGSGDYNAPAVQYLNAANLHSDNRWDHPFFERLNGFGIGVGYETSLVGSYAAGSTTVNLADGSTFCLSSYNEKCGTILIRGAGAGGTNLQTSIVSGLPAIPAPTDPGGQSAAVTISPGIVTAVDNPKVYPSQDVIGGLYIENGELDVGWGLLGVGNNAEGDVSIEHAEVFYATHGAANANSLKPYGLRFTDSLCYGCGNAQSPTPTQSHSIYWLDISNAQTNDVVINNVRFECANTNGGCQTATGGQYLVGGVYINGARTVEFVNNQLYDADNNSQYKSALFTNIKNLNVAENTFYYDRFLTDWTSSVAVNLGVVNAAHIINNKFVNLTTSQIPVAVASDQILTGAVAQGNLFSGQIGQQFSQNIANANVRNTYQDQNHVQKYGGTAPVNGTWQVGDIMWNSSPSVGNPIGWICVAAGTPGTWASFGIATSP